MDGRHFIATLSLSLRNPRQAARMVIGWPLTAAERWSILALSAVCSTLSAEFLVSLAPAVADPMTAAVLASPIAFAALQFAGLAVMAGLVFLGGRLFGGIGSFSEVLSVIGWVQIVLLGLQLAQIVAMLTVPALAALVGLVSIAVTLWILPNFIAEVHGFRSAFKTFFGMVGAMLGVVVVLSIVLVLAFGMGA
jgi:hypothetical protein